MKLFDDPLSNILTKQLDACTVRQQVVANNIANENTPGFKKSKVNFQQQLKETLHKGNGISLNTSNARHISPGQGRLAELAPEVIQVQGTSMKAGQNNVDIDEEMVDLAANTLLYKLAAKVRGDRTNMMSYVIKGG